MIVSFVFKSEFERLQHLIVDFWQSDSKGILSRIENRYSQFVSPRGYPTKRVPPEGALGLELEGELISQMNDREETYNVGSCVGCGIEDEGTES